MKKCTDCKYCVQEDYGYSNYTVEGTNADCLLGEHPDMPVDRFYGEEPELQYAEKCDRFIAGEGPGIDVDREALADWNDPLSSAYTDDEEIKELLDRWDAKSN
jgi:hypothetical protein